MDSSPVPNDPQRESLFKFNLQDWVDKKMETAPAAGVRGSLGVELIVAVVGFLILTEVSYFKIQKEKFLVPDNTVQCYKSPGSDKQG